MWQIIAALDLEIWAIVKIRRFKSWAETGMYEVVLEQRLLQELPTILWKDFTEWDLLQFVWILWLYVMGAFPVGRWHLQCFHSDFASTSTSQILTALHNGMVPCPTDLKFDVFSKHLGFSKNIVQPQMIQALLCLWYSLHCSQLLFTTSRIPCTILTNSATITVASTCCLEPWSITHT